MIFLFLQSTLDFVNLDPMNFRFYEQIPISLTLGIGIYMLKKFVIVNFDLMNFRFCE